VIAILEVRNLKTYYNTLGGVVKAVDGVSFTVKDREVLGLVGESGCGKTTTGFSIIRLVAPPGKIVHGELLFDGEDMLRKTESEMREEIRGKKISMVFQGGSSALSPLLKVEDQIADTIFAHENADEEAVSRRVKELLQLTGIDPRRSDNYPHEFSGGMNQRVLIATALACGPQLVIADEPTTALDVIVQAQIVDLMKSIQEKLGHSAIWIMHDMSVVAHVSDSIAVMYAGKIVERSDTPSFFKKPIHPYSLMLIKAVPSVEGPKERLRAITGNPPNLVDPPRGCRFHPRCKYAEGRCASSEPELVEVEANHFVACHTINTVEEKK
jgi:peptide/nickel transport system ATP-binding protein